MSRKRTTRIHLLSEIQQDKLRGRPVQAEEMRCATDIPIPLPYPCTIILELLHDVLGLQWGLQIGFEIGQHSNKVIPFVICFQQSGL